jgi:hypothetical protein
MLIAGVNPEISAALALVDHDGRLVEVARPVLRDGSAGRAAIMRHCWRRSGRAQEIVCEFVSARPG